MNQLLIKTMQIANTNFALLLLRAGAALMMLTHGVPKLMQFFSGEPIAFASVFGMSAALSLALAVFAEVLCSIFILFGLGIRLSSIPLIITMLIAAFHIHGADPFSSKEKSLLFGLIFIVLLLTGAGKYSIDYLLSEKMKKSQ